MLQNLEDSIGGFFYKRKSLYYDRNDKIKSAGTLMSGLFSKITNSAKYDKRYFYLSIKDSTLSYGSNQNTAISDPSYRVQLRDIESVKKSIVSMPVRSADGSITSFKEVSIFDTNPDLDRGPELVGINNVFEVKIGNKLMTLYSDDNILLELFVQTLTKILELKT